MGRVVLGLGSNLGDRLANLQRSVHALRSAVVIEVVSSVYETQPVGYRDQPWFLNAVCAGTTAREPEALLTMIKQIERDLGRRPGVRFGPRTIDIDILFYDDGIIKTPTLEIPHPRLAERAFVLVPLAEILADLVHPVAGRTASELLGTLDRPEETRLYRRDWLQGELTKEQSP